MSNQRADGMHKAQVWLPVALWDLFGRVAGDRNRSAELATFVRWRCGEEIELPTPAARSEPRGSDS